MKKILGILVVTLICILGLCSCAGPETRAKNQDLVDRAADALEDVLDKGTEIDVNGKRVCLYSLTAHEITLGQNWFYEHDFTDFTRLVQYSNYFKLYTKNTTYTLSNTVAGYIIYVNK